MENLTETSDYSKFDPYWYVEHYFGTDEACMNHRQEQEVFHKIFAEHDIRGKRLLDVGTGPTIHSVITASNYVDEIFLSDYASSNLEYLERWRRSELSYPTQMVDYVISLEGRKMTAEQRENEVREKVKGILPIDVTSEQPLGCDYDGGTFDVIMASGCFEAAVHDVAGFKKCIETVSTLLNQGGCIIITDDLEGENYQVGEYKYRALSITRQEVKTTMTQTGYDIKLYMDFPASTVDAQYNDCSGYYFVVATK